jgi:transposase
MESRDARKLTPEAQYEIRRQAVKSYKEGNTFTAIASMLEVDRNTVSKWISKYTQRGLRALKPQQRGPKLGATMQLSVEEQKVVSRLIVDKLPDQLKLNFALWTREAVGLLITEKTGKVLDLRQVGRYLKRWGFTPQRPIKRAYQRDDKKVKTWLEEEYPAIKKAAEAGGGEIHWADEVGIKSHDHRGRGFAPKGKTPVRMHNPSYEKVNMISSVTNQGKLRFMCYESSFTYQVFHRFLRGLIEDAGGRKVYVIVDNLRVHHAKKIKRWLRIYSHLIEVHYLPSYSPDLNPDEYLNCDLKTELAKRPERREKGKWAKTVTDTMEMLSNESERVASYFKAQPIQYAA